MGLVGFFQRRKEISDEGQYYDRCYGEVKRFYDDIHHVTLIKCKNICADMREYYQDAIKEGAIESDTRLLKEFCFSVYELRAAALKEIYPGIFEEETRLFFMLTRDFGDLKCKVEDYKLKSFLCERDFMKHAGYCAREYRAALMNK